MSRPLHEKLVEVWSEANSLKEAVKLTGSKSKDPRYWHRLRRKAEAAYGIILPPHQEDKSTDRDIECPSSLDIDSALEHQNFIITSCANDSPIEEEFLSQLEEMASDMNAQLLVIPIRYFNPSAMHRADGYAWPESIHKYALLDDLHISEDLVISGLRLQATAKRPLSGIESNSGEKSAIYGHSQLAMELVATPKNELPKLMHTTGAINKPMYSASKAGGSAAFNHSVSAVYISLQEGKFFHTQLCFDGSGFYFFRKYYGEKSPMLEGQSPVNVMADIHAEIADYDVIYQREDVNEYMDVSTLIWHDIHNHTAHGKHNTPIENIRLAGENRLCVESEIEKDIELLNMLGEGKLNYIIESNHDEHLEFWLNNFNHKKDPYNAIFAAELLAETATTDQSVLEAAFSLKDYMIDSDYEFVCPNNPLKIYGIDVSQHGHRGTNGSRGSRRNIAHTSSKSVIGHSHSPGITQGCWQVGAAIHDTYAKGLSSWMSADVFIHPNGKRQMLTYIDGESLLDFI